MKIRKKAVILISIAAVSLAACGIRSDRNVSSGEMVVPEVSSEDLLVSSLEYLLLDDTEDGTESDEQQETEDEMAGQDTQNPAEGTEQVPEEQTVQEEKDEIQGEQAVIYYGDGGSLALKDELVEVEELTPEALIDALARHNIVSLDTKVLSFEQRQEEGRTVLCLDLSKAFGEYLRTMSKEAECIIVSAVVDTFLGNYTGDVVYITVGGEMVVTSKHEYTEPIEKCAPAELLEMMEK